MNKKSLPIIAVIFIVLLLVGNPFYIIKEGHQVVVTQFGDPIGDPIKKAGLHLKIPFIQKVNYFEERMLEWDGYPSEIPTKDKKYIWVDATARWKIVDALSFFKSVSNERGAQAILDGIIDASVRDAVTNHNLIELVRSTNRIIENKKDITDNEEFMQEIVLEKINVGRDQMRKNILKNAKVDLGTRYGIELIDVRIKRVNYVEQVRSKVYDRMIAERRRAAEKYRSEGRGVSADIAGRTEKELKEITSNAYKKAQVIKGKADAKAAKIYADAYSKDPEFYSFLKTLETYGNTVDVNTMIILTTEGDYYKYLQKISP